MKKDESKSHERNESKYERLKEYGPTKKGKGKGKSGSGRKC